MTSKHPTERAVAIAGALVIALACSCSSGTSSGGSASTTTTSPGPDASVPLAKDADTYELAYLSTDASGTTVFLTDGKGSETDVVAKLPGRAEGLRWSPDGSKLLLDGDGSAAGDFELSVIDAESGDVTPLAPSSSSSEGGAAWSPDGEQVAFFSDRDGGFAGYVVDVGGGEVTRVTPADLPAVADLTWSPDGSQLAFSTSSTNDSAVWVVNADGSDPKQVSTDAGSTQPVWSPDGSLLAVSAQPKGSASAGIRTLDPESGDTIEVANTEFRDAFPVWSPDGKRIYFVSALPNDDADGGSADDILLADSDGEGDDPAAVTADPVGVEGELSVTPDGELIVFSVQRMGDKEVFVANADGTGAIPVSRSDRLDAFGAWRPGTGPDA